jgi:sulfatase modifying factor 1
VKYLVLGRVSRLGNIIVTARMVDVATGNVMQTAEVSAEDARGLQGALTELVRILQMSDAEKKAYKPTLREFPKEFTNSVGMKMVLIPAGEFWMGSKLSPPEVVARYGGNEGLCQDEQPRHRVRITQSFYLAACEVTVGQFRQFADATGYQTDAEKEGWSYGWKDGKWGRQQGLNWRAPGFQQNFDHPVVCVSWNDAKAFCEWLGRKEGKSYRLPTEAEWEYACRAGSDTEFWWGDEMDTTGRVANVSDSKHWNPGAGFKNMQMDDGYQFTAPVANYRANGFGLYDMIWNAWEWCQDWYGEGYYGQSPAEDPHGPQSGQYRVLRGGSWVSYAFNCRSAGRDRVTPDDRFSDCGFRVASGTE